MCIRDSAERFEQDRAEYEARLKASFEVAAQLTRDRDYQRREGVLWMRRAVQTAEELVQEREAHRRTQESYGDTVPGIKFREVVSELEINKSTLMRCNDESDRLRKELADASRALEEALAQVKLLGGDKGGLLAKIEDLERLLREAETAADQKQKEHEAQLKVTEQESLRLQAAAATELASEQAHSKGLEADKVELGQQVAALMARLEAQQQAHKEAMSTAHAKENLAYESLARAEDKCLEALEEARRLQARVDEMEAGTKMLYDDLEHALKSATELRSVAPEAQVDAECRYGAWVGLYRSIARTLRTKFPVARNIPSPTNPVSYTHLTLPTKRIV
eukprot:TRINITY_DN14056_c0_g1_i1.p1 TRINITY_DN14056_c0_g1~~TRINITY_DN14056_c0_g1_i1.p1  ORF type:complete len:336 (+),score=95.98 TRINITY_DN14056_c0_g1_i1:132-1139(+)